MQVSPKFPMVDNMRRFGGNFITKLAEAMVAADPKNYQTLCNAFPEVVEEYGKPEHSIHEPV